MTAEQVFARPDGRGFELDRGLLCAVVALLVLGLIMVASASTSLAERDFGSAGFYLRRQAMFLLVGLLAGASVLCLPLALWRSLAGVFLLVALFLMVSLLIPGIGREVNGSVRWLPLLGFNLQPSEFLKLAVIVYLAAYLTRHAEAVANSWAGFLWPLLLLMVCAGLLLQQPDFGALVLIVAIGLAMLFVGGAPLSRLLLIALLAVAAGWMLIIESPYRLDRLVMFRDPWADPFNRGFQLTQSLIAIGRGEWVGVGLGSSVQKLFYLPEAHTDFLFAVLAEELGLLGVVSVIGLYGFVCMRIFLIGSRNLRQRRLFAGYLCLGVATWLGLQSFVNMGVNMGMLPTKGLTLPLLSYGGSSLIMTLVALALVLRAEHERVQALVAPTAAAMRVGQQARG
jgi:cell division protein FtsW